VFASFKFIDRGMSPPKSAVALSQPRAVGPFASGENSFDSGVDTASFVRYKFGCGAARSARVRRWLFDK
ncbi:MAG: hypothetical protein MJA84_01945, partial [Firmicutes bacterium]|nr:hypothetical protein [Bacillota bacterium]